MGLGKLLRSMKYDVTNTVTGESDSFVIVDNIAPDWPHSTYRGGMNLPGAWRAANLIADLIGSVPWSAYRERGGDPVIKISPTPPLLAQPAPPDTRMTTFSSWALDLLWHGNAIGIIASRNAEGWPTSVLPVPAEMVQARRVTDTKYSPLPVGSIEYGIGSLKNMSPHDVIHIKGPCAPGSLRGMGVLEAHLNTLSLGHEQIKQARSLSQNGVPTGLLKTLNPDATQVDATELKNVWLTAQRTRTVAVLNATTEFVPLSWNPEEMQLVDARKFTLHELGLIFGLPLSFLGVEQSNRTYTNVEQEAVNLIKFTLSGHLARFEQTLALAFPHGSWVKANLDAVLRADTLTRYEAHKIGLDAGFLTLDEVRTIEDRAPLPEKPVETDPFKEGEKNV